MMLLGSRIGMNTNVQLDENTYIVKNTSGWIDTGGMSLGRYDDSIKIKIYDPMHTNVKCMVDCMFSQGSSWAYLFGINPLLNSGGVYNGWGAFISCNGKACYFNLNNRDVVIGSGKRIVYEFGREGNYSYWKEDGVYKYNSSITSSNIGYYCPGIFTNANSTSEEASVGSRIYRIQIYQDDVKLYDIVPAKTSNGYGCFYDIVTKQYFNATNESSFSCVGHTPYVQH